MAAIDRFIEETLRSEGERMFARQSSAIAAATVRRSGRLLSGRRITSNGRMLTLTHPDYERFLDMRQLSGNGKKTRRRIHNRFKFGTYQSIAERLMYGYTEEVRQEFEQKTDIIWDR